VNRFRYFCLLFFIAGFLLNGCMFPSVKLFTDASDPLKEFVLEGDETEKILMIPVYGIISDMPEKRVIFLQPKFYELMDKIGVGVTANTSGENKDMGSPFRKGTDAEEKIFQSLTDSLGKRFVDLVVEHREIGPEVAEEVSTARIYLSDEALTLGLIDEIGYISDIISRTKELAGLDENSRVIVYRRVEYPDDNLYNIQSRYGDMKSPLIDLGLPDTSILNRAGFYYLWPSGVDGN